MDQQLITKVVETSKQQLTPTLLKNSDNLPEQVKKVLQVKYIAKPFSRLTEAEQHGHALALIIKINVVTGWPVPDSKEERNILAEQLKLYLIENWPLFNVDEIMYAMRSYATVLSNWGKNMNLSLIGKAMIDYEKERTEVSKLEESKQPQTENLLTMKAEWSSVAEMYYQDFLNGKLNLRIMPAEIYEACFKANYISLDAWEDWVSDAKKFLIGQYVREAEGAGSEKERFDAEQKLNNISTGEYDLAPMAKKLAIQFLYETAGKQKRKNLFV